ncbi:MAG TPA: hypothetical protein VMT47_16525 [Polyangia bacterium]|nr:hypothetical protein [Polyangia bacterium]
MLGFAAGACTVGAGAGRADGMFFDVGCNNSNSLAQPPGKPYSLAPAFFAGEPIEDVCPPPGQCSGPHTNRLVIRLQHTGNRVEVNDTLYFDVKDAYKVAQCVRGQTLLGVPQWDLRKLTASDGTLIPGLSWCDWNAADADGGADAGGGGADAGATADSGAPLVMTAARPRINLSTQDYVQASFAPLYTCIEARSVAVALPGSWIEFQDFGAAVQSADPENRTAVDGDFRVNFGERLRASFHLMLGDEAVENAIKTHTAIPDTRIGGELDGYFDFDLERGRAAQPFP